MRFFEIAQPERVVIATKQFEKDLKDFSKIAPSILKTLSEFIAFRKEALPSQSFGKKDLPYSNGDLRGFRHTHLVFGQVIMTYQLTGNQIRLCCITTHKAIDGVPPRGFIAFLNGLSEDDYHPFSLGGPAEDTSITPDEKKAVEEFLYALAGDDAEFVRDALRDPADLMEFFREHFQDRSEGLLGKLGGVAGLQAMARDVLKSLGVREARSAA